MPSTQNPVKRLFFACWPDDAVRESIMATSDEIIIPNGRRIQAENLHLTLAFIGDVSEQQAERYALAAESVNAPAFDMTLQGYGHFQRPKVFYMGVPSIPKALQQLYEGLNEQLIPQGYHPEQRAYTPHVSLYRKAEQLVETLPAIAIDWHIDRFFLAESTFGPGYAIYRRIQEYKLHKS